MGIFDRKLPFPARVRAKGNGGFLDPESSLVGLRTQTQNAAFFERKGPERKPCAMAPREVFKSQKNDRNAFFER